MSTGFLHLLEIHGMAVKRVCRSCSVYFSHQVSASIRIVWNFMSRSFFRFLFCNPPLWFEMSFTKRLNFVAKILMLFHSLRFGARVCIQWHLLISFLLKTRQKNCRRILDSPYSHHIPKDENLYCFLLSTETKAKLEKVTQRIGITPKLLHQYLLMNRNDRLSIRELSSDTEKSSAATGTLYRPPSFLSFRMF